MVAGRVEICSSIDGSSSCPSPPFDFFFLLFFCCFPGRRSFRLIGPSRPLSSCCTSFFCFDGDFFFFFLDGVVFV